jgi:hypothetical protein
MDGLPRRRGGGGRGPWPATQPALSMYVPALSAQATMALAPTASAASSAPAAASPASPAPATLAAAGPARAAWPAKSVLHVLNGDSTADRLRAAGIPGEVTLAADLLYEGPAVATSSPERWRRERARFLAQSGYDDYEECLARLAAWDHALDGFRLHDEVVLWFEHDLFDQLQLCRLLSWFAARDTGFTRVTLVQAGDYLGRMPPQLLAGLLDARQEVTDAQKALAREAWAAFCAPVPTRLEALLARIDRAAGPLGAAGAASFAGAAGADSSPLPYLAGALARHLEEFPGLGDGLSRSERQALVAVAAGPLPFGALFRAVETMEERVFMPDLSLLRRLRELASGPRPLLRLDTAGGASPRTPTVAVTGVGQAVLAGREDWIEIRGGIDCWLGGVHLQGRYAAWRWDRQACRLVAAAP